MWSRPVSRILYRPEAAVTIYLRRTFPPACSGLPGGASTGMPIAEAGGQPNLLLGLAPNGVCLAVPVARNAGELLPHLFTLTADRGRRRFVSVALSAGRPAWDFPSVLPLGVRTFLGSVARAAITRPAPPPHYRRYAQAPEPLEPRPPKFSERPEPPEGAARSQNVPSPRPPKFSERPEPAEGSAHSQNVGGPGRAGFGEGP